MSNFIIFSLSIFCLLFVHIESKTENTCYDTKCHINLDCEEGGGVIGLKNMEYGFKANSCTRSEINCFVTDPCCEPMADDCFEPYDSSTLSDALKKCQLRPVCAVDNRRTNSMDCKDVTRFSSFTTADYECLPASRILSTVGKTEHFNDVSYLVYGGETFNNFSDVQCTINSAVGVRVNVEIQQLFAQSAPTQVQDSECKGRLFIKGAIGQSVYCDNGNVNSLDLDDFHTPLTVTLRDFQDGDHVWMTFEGEHSIICEDLNGLQSMKKLPDTVEQPGIDWSVIYTTSAIIVGAVVVVLIITLIIFLWHRKHRSNRQDYAIENNYTAIPMTSFGVPDQGLPASQGDQIGKEEKQNLGSARQYDEINLESEEIPEATTSTAYNRISEFKNANSAVEFKNYDHIGMIGAEISVNNDDYDHITNVPTGEKPQGDGEEGKEKTASEIDEDPSYQHLR